jgi:hypothetical protein
MTTDNKNLPAEQASFGLPVNVDGLSAYAASSGAGFPGDLFKLNGKNGKYALGADGEDVPTGSAFAVILQQATAGFVSWVDGKVADQAFIPISEATPTALAKLRESLGDLDRTQWPDTDLKGRPVDPFKESARVPMVQMSDGRLCTFLTSSLSGCRAVRSLIQKVLVQLRADPEAAGGRVPVVTNEVASYQHSVRSVGEIFYPSFDLIDWVPPATVMSALAGDCKYRLPSDNAEEPPQRGATRRQALQTEPVRRRAEAQDAPAVDDDRSVAAARERLERLRVRRGGTVTERD